MFRFMFRLFFIIQTIKKENSYKSHSLNDAVDGI